MKPNDKAIEAARAAILKAMAERNCIIPGNPFNETNYDEFDASGVVELSKVALDAAYAAQFQSEEYAGLVERLRSQNELYVEKCVGTHDVDENKIEPLCNEAADALEAVLAEQDALKHTADAHVKGWMGQCAIASAAIKERDNLVKERDDLLARLAPVEAIENDKDDPTREYIPLPGGWEIQTKGKGSSYRLLDKKTGERHMILAGDALFVQEFVTRMAKEINLSYRAQHVASVKDDDLVEIAKNAIRVFVYASPRNGTDWHGQYRAAIAAIRPHIEAAEREKWQKMLARMGAGTTKTGAVNE